MTVPRVSKLVLIYFPSLVRSLSDVAPSELARSIRLYNNPSTTQPKKKGYQKKKKTHQHRSLHAPPTASLQPRSASRNRRRPPTRRRRPSRELFLPSIPPLPTLNDESKDTMDPRAPLIPIRARRPPIPVPTLKHLLHALQAGDNLLPQGREDPVPDDLHGLGGGCRAWGARRSWIASLWISR